MDNYYEMGRALVLDGARSEVVAAIEKAIDPKSKVIPLEELRAIAKEYGYIKPEEWAERFKFLNTKGNPDEILDEPFELWSPEWKRLAAASLRNSLFPEDDRDLLDNQVLLTLYNALLSVDFGQATS